ncbi:jg14788 [Pararge aegeria aegeria]|uniref:Jg14788 protein n=1 Tax=Pararge aegeria aegeria TaxID=348720 RepID=A0A8S4SH86_9NEOP|nr:jg14788 [Pararge aegeria aegeria]
MEPQEFTNSSTASIVETSLEEKNRRRFFRKTGRLVASGSSCEADISAVDCERLARYPVIDSTGEIAVKG